MLLLMAASALFNYLKKRQEGETDWSDVEKPATPTQPRKKASDWEEELRRLLEEETPAKPQRPPPPPPIVREFTPPPLPSAPPPVPQSRPSMAATKDFGQPKMYKGHCNHCGVHIEFPSNMLEETIYCPACHQRTVLRPFSHTTVETLSHQPQLSQFKESAAIFERSELLDDRVAERLANVMHQPVEMTSAERRVSTRSPEVTQVVSLFGNPRTARQAVIASIILNPPKALEN